MRIYNISTHTQITSDTISLQFHGIDKRPSQQNNFLLEL
jgi:hypothetical protein